MAQQFRAGGASRGKLSAHKGRFTEKVEPLSVYMLWASFRNMAGLAGPELEIICLMNCVILAGRDWRFRALLRAQLLEEKIDVEAYEMPREALNHLTDLKSLPRLLVADLFGSPSPKAELKLLSKWTALIPIWIILTHIFRTEESLEHQGFERVLYRPLDVAQFVKDIKKRCESL